MARPRAVAEAGSMNSTAAVSAHRPPPFVLLSEVGPPSDAPGHGNQVLGALDASTLGRWAMQMQEVDLKRGQVLCEAGSTALHVTFPVDATVSLLSFTRDGSSVEVAAVGREGLIGMPVLMGGDNSAWRAEVQAAGSAWRMPAHVLREELRLGGPSLPVLLRYVQSLAAQMAQTAACNRHHGIDQQLCRRLLQGLDRSRGDTLLMTHEAAALLLGVRREGVTAAALKLQHAGIIRYRRGRIEVLDRSGLQARSCECHVHPMQVRLAGLDGAGPGPGAVRRTLRPVCAARQSPQGLWPHTAAGRPSARLYPAQDAAPRTT